MNLIEHVLPRRRALGVRSWSIAVVAAGAVLGPAGPALANHMPGMANGTMCPHASGEGPDSLAAAGPGESSGPARAPSEQPVTAPGATASQPAAAPQQPTRPATRPAQPGSRVSQPATTQVQVQQPATTTEQVAPAQAVQPAPAVARVRATARRADAEPARASGPRAAQRKPATRVSFEQRFNGLEAKAARGSEWRDPVARPVQSGGRSAPAPSAPLLVAFALVALVALAAAVARRGRGAGGAVATRASTPPVTPSFAELSLEAELHEIVAEASARALLGGMDEGDAGGKASPEHEPASAR